MRSVTITLTERDARLFQQRITVWMEQPGLNEEERQAFDRVNQQIRYQSGEQTTTARG